MTHKCQMMVVNDRWWSGRGCPFMFYWLRSTIETLRCKQWVFNYVLLEGFGGIPHFHDMTSLWLLERGPWMLLGVLEGFFFSSLGQHHHLCLFFPFLFLEKEDELWIVSGKAKRRDWRVNQLLGALRKCFYLLYGFNFFSICSICKPKFSTMES